MHLLTQLLTQTNPGQTLFQSAIVVLHTRLFQRQNITRFRLDHQYQLDKLNGSSRKEKLGWVLTTNLPKSMVTPKQRIKLHGKQMQIEETFRDLKSPAYRFGILHRHLQANTVRSKKVMIPLIYVIYFQTL